MASNSPPPGATCESCGRDGEVLEPVHRVYLAPGAGDTPQIATTMPDVEWWCRPCRAVFPHAPAHT